MRRISQLFLLLCINILLTSSLFAQDSEARESRIQQEKQNIQVPPQQQSTNAGKGTGISKDRAPSDLNVDSEDIRPQEKIIPNEGNPYFTFSGGLVPYQASLGILKYFIPEFWGQLDLNVVFLPTAPVANYYTNIDLLKPFVAFRILGGYSFFSKNIYEISLFTHIQFAFVSTSDVPMFVGLGFRFIFQFVYIDLGLSYAFTIGNQTRADLFNGFFPAISLGFRF